MSNTWYGYDQIPGNSGDQVPGYLVRVVIGYRWYLVRVVTRYQGGDYSISVVTGYQGYPGKSGDKVLGVPK